jgi:transposase
MRDTELYFHLLGLVKPWTVGQVKLSVEKLRVDVKVEHPVGVAWGCPQCTYQGPLYDHSEERTWRHLDSCQFLTYLHAQIPRIKCPEHGVLQVSVPWAEPRSRFTLLFERLAVEILLQSTVEGTAQILRLSWKEAMHLMERAVVRGQARKEQRLPTRLGIDDKHVGKSHPYLTVLYDLCQGTVMDVLETRKDAPLRSYILQFPSGQIEQVQAVAADMWEPYTRVVYSTIPDGYHKLVYDRFHIMKHANEAVDKVRAQENRELVAQGDDRLVGAQTIFRYALENLPERYQERFKALQQADLKTGRAFALKESLRSLWDCPDEATGKQHFALWMDWAKSSGLAPLKNLARLVGAHAQGIFNYFRHRITSAACEGLNNAIATLSKRAYGYRNLKNLRTALLFHLGGLPLHPVLPATHAIGR